MDLFSENHFTIYLKIIFTIFKNFLRPFRISPIFQHFRCFGIFLDPEYHLTYFSFSFLSHFFHPLPFPLYSFFLFPQKFLHHITLQNIFPFSFYFLFLFLFIFLSLSLSSLLSSPPFNFFHLSLFLPKIWPPPPSPGLRPPPPVSPL